MVLLDGNVPHGITRLSAPKGTTAVRPELERFSLIMFSTFKRRDRMLKHGNYSSMWQEEWKSAVLFRGSAAKRFFFSFLGIRNRLAGIRVS